MIVTGANIATKDDPLSKIKVEYFYHKIIQPNPEIESKIRQLRIIKALDPKMYSMLKRQLPYVVCGIFNPLVRRTEYFAYTEYFMLDIDKIEEKGLSIADLRNKFEADNRILMCFESPGKDGLKLLMKLKERCYDAVIYSVFYKSFLIKFSTEYSLEQVIDARTSDVARACFVSVDPTAYYNPNADPVDMEKYVDIHDSSELLRQKKKLELQFKEIDTTGVEKLETGPDADALSQIKAMLNPRFSAAVERKEVFVPPALDELMIGLAAYINEAGVELKAIINIQFGKKIQLQSGLKQAEINLFYGKRGFSVVQSPRRGTNDELNNLMAQLIEQYIHQVS